MREASHRLMTCWGCLIQSPARDFPDGLAGGFAPAPPRRYALLAALLLICLIPRVWMAWRWDLLWSDAVIYLHLSEALEKGDFDTAFCALGLNTFPVILMWLRRTGLDWTTAGHWWSVLMATLTVLPLFGWIRRQFDEQVALGACLLYAIHPKLLAYTPLIIRDPTYWFLFALTLYLTWRAVTEMRWWLFPAAGVALTLAAYTRAEGWLLLVPLLLWVWWRLPAVAGSRARLILGTTACLAVIPLLVVLVNITWLRGHSRWEIGTRVGNFRAAWSWLLSSADALLTRPAVAGESLSARATREDNERAPEWSPAADRPNPGDSAHHGVTSEKLSALVLGRKVFVRFLKSLTCGYGLLLAVGLWRWRHVVFRRDQRALLLHNVLLLCGISMYYTLHKGIDIRYCLPIVIAVLPYTALGLLQMVEWLAAPARHAAASLPRRRTLAMAGLLAGIAMIGLPDAVLSARPVMLQQAELGRWILEHGGPGQTIVGPDSCLRLLEYHSKGRANGFARIPDGNTRPLLETVHDYRPDVVVVWDDVFHREVFAARAEIAQDCLKRGYEPVPREQLPPSCRQVQVFVARKPSLRR